MPKPGAERLTSGPEVEKAMGWLFLSTAPTAMVLGLAAGWRTPSRPVFPAATMTGTPRVWAAVRADSRMLLFPFPPREILMMAAPASSAA